MKVNRKELLSTLESVAAGLSPKDIIQSSCFVFQLHRVVTFDDEVFCSAEVPPMKIAGAVRGGPLVALLKRLPEDQVDVTADGGKLLIKGKNRRGTLVLEQEVLLPVDAVEEPGEWKRLPKGFKQAVDVVLNYVSTDESDYPLTCVHIHPKWVEACDNFQLTRYWIKSGFSEPTLIRGRSLKHVLGLDMTEFSETKSWLHFRNADGLRLSCRRYIEQYSDLSDLLDTKGREVKLPKGLRDAVMRAEIFSSEDSLANRVTVELGGGWLKLSGEGASGRYEERCRIEGFDGSARFLISPRLLVEVSKRADTCIIGEGKLMVYGGKWRYVSCTMKERE